MADNKRDLTGVPVEDLSAEEAAVAANELTEKIAELIAEMQRNEMRRGSLMRENEDIHLASGFKGFLAQLMNQKSLEQAQQKKDSLGLSIREAKKLQADQLRKSIIDFRSSAAVETEDQAKDRYGELELKALRSLGDLYREKLIDGAEYARRINEIDEQSNRVYGQGAQNLDASKTKYSDDVIEQVLKFKAKDKDESLDDMRTRINGLADEAFRSLRENLDSGRISREEYDSRFRRVDEQTQHFNEHPENERYRHDYQEGMYDAAANDAIFDRVKDFGAKTKDAFLHFGADLGNSKFGRGISKFYSIASPFYQKNKESFRKVFSGQTGAKGAAGALSGAAGMIPDVNKFTKAAKLALEGMGKVVQWSGEYTEDRAETRQKGIAGGFGEGAMGTEKAQQYKDIGESLNKGGGQAFVSFAANVNHLLEQMRRGGGGGALETANQRYGLVLNGSGANGLAKDADEVIRNIISRVSAYRKAGNHQAVAGLMQTLGVDQKNMELFMHGQAAYDARVRTKGKMADAATAQRLDESAMKTVESDFDAEKSKRLRNESWSRVGNAVTRAWNGVTRAGNAVLGEAGATLTGDRRERTDGITDNYLATDENAAERKAVAPIAMQEDLRKLTSAVPFIPATVNGGAAGGGVSQENSLNVKVDKVELHTTSSTLEGTGKDIGVGIEEGLESWSKPLVKNFGDSEL